MLSKCKCKHEGQDKLHGPEVRVYNPVKASETFRCTVCGNEKWIQKQNKGPAK